MRELFGKIKMKDVGRDQEDRLRLSIFIKRQKEDHNFLEKLLQQSKEKQAPEVTRKSRRLSGNNLPPQKRSREENIEKMIQDLHCAQCHRTYKDPAQARDKKENKHHFCYNYGHLKTSLQIDPTPTPTKKAKLCCTFCPQLKNIVFSNRKELMKHLVLAHKTQFFIDQIQKQNERKGLAKEDLKCFHSKCEVTSADQEDHLIHIAVDHGKLFNALMHDTKNNMKNVAKELFPKKFKEHDSHNWEQGSAGSSQKVAKRNLNRVDEAQAGPSKKAKTEEKKNSETPSQPPGPLLKPQTSKPQSSKPPSTTQYSPSTASTNREANPRRMKRETCVVCGDSQSNKVTLYNHLAGEHFYQEISRKYPGTGQDREDHHPCSFPYCTEVFTSAPARVLHLGRKHGQVELCLATWVAAQARQKEEKERKKTSTRVIKCRTCLEEFATKALRQLHTCHSLLAQPPAGDRRTSVDEVFSVPRAEKDMRGEFSDASVDSSELNEAVGGPSHRMEDRVAVEEEEEAEMEDNVAVEEEEETEMEEELETEMEEEVESDPWRGKTCVVAAGCGRKDCVECEYCGRRYHTNLHDGHPHYPCHSTTGCNLCFPSEKLMFDHFNNAHGFEAFG